MSDATIDAKSLIDLLGGQNVRSLIGSQPVDVRRTITRSLKDLLAEIDPGSTQSCIASSGSGAGKTQILAPFIHGSDLIPYLQQYRKPQYLTRAHPGKAPPNKREQTRWICSLCPNNKHIKTRTNDLRRHLEEGHLCARPELDLIFNPKDPERLWEYFGPCTEQQAFDNGWDVRSFRRGKDKQAASKKRISEIKVSGSKGVQMVKAMCKKVGGTSDSDLASSMESLKVQEVQRPTTMTTSISGSTAVPPADQSSTTGTYYSIQREVSHSYLSNHDNGQESVEQHDHMADSAGFGKQFDNASSDAGPWPPTGTEMNLRGDFDWGEGPFQRLEQQAASTPYPAGTMGDLMSNPEHASTSNSQLSNEYYDFQMIDIGDFDPDSFPHLFERQRQGQLSH